MMTVGFEPTTLYRLAPKASALTTRPHHLIFIDISYCFIFRNFANIIYNNKLLAGSFVLLGFVKAYTT